MLCRLGNSVINKRIQLKVTNFVKCSSTATTIKKQDYYKNIGETQETAENVKPADWDEALPFESIPGPKPLPILGNVFRFFPIVGEYYGEDFSDIFERWNKEYGDIVAVRKLDGRRNMLMLYAAEDIEYMFRNDSIWPRRRLLDGFDYYRRVIKKDIFHGVIGTATSQGKEWFDFRSVVNPIMMQPRSIELYIDKIDGITSEFVDNIKFLASRNPESEMPENFINELNKWSLEAIGVTAFDTRMGCLNRNLEPSSEAQMFIKHVNELFELMYKIEILPNLWRFYSTPTWKRYVAVMDFITSTIVKHVEKAKKEDLSDKADHELSIFQRLLKIDEKIALAMAIDMMQAGVDTTSRTSGAALYFLAKNPEAQSQLREESRKLLPTPNSPVTKETIKEASYVKAVIKETQRFAPIAPVNSRTTVKDLVIGGYRVPKGTEIATGNLLISKQTKYFTRPNEFLPERWLRSTTNELSHKNVNPFVSLPFGFGPRSCLGKRIALMELEVALLKLIRNFELSWPHEDMTFQTRLLYGIAKPLKLHVKEIKE